MPVIVPITKRTDPAAPAASTKMTVEAPNLVGATAPLREGVNSAIGQTAEAYEARENLIKKQTLQAQDIKTTEYTNGWENQYREALAAINQKDGDTTADYLKLDEDAKAWAQDIFAKNENMPPEMTQMLQRKINTATGKLSGLRNIQQTTQNYKYRRAVADSTVKLNQDAFLDYGQHLDIKKPDTFLALQAIRDAMVGVRVSEGDQRGVLRKDENGVPLWSEGEVGNEVKKDMGGALIPLVHALNAAGKVKEAKKLINDYGDSYLNAHDRGKLLADNDDADVKNQALALVSRLKNNSGTAAYDELKGADVSDAVKFKAREIIDTMDRQNKQANDRKREEGRRFLYRTVEERQSSKTPFVSAAQFKDTLEYKQLQDVLEPSDLKALEQRIEAPNTSDPEAKIKIQQLWMNTGFKNMAPLDFQKSLVGLDAQDRTRYNSLYEASRKATKTMSESSARSRMTSMNSMVMEDSKLAGLFPKAGTPDKWNDKDREYYSTMMGAWADYYSDNVPVELADPTAQKSIVRNFVNSYGQNNPPPSKSWFEGGLFGAGKRDVKKLPELSRRAQVPNSPVESNGNTGTLGVKNLSKAAKVEAKPVTSTVDVSKMSPEQFGYWEDQYVKETGNASAPDDINEFQAWINKQVNK